MPRKTYERSGYVNDPEELVPSPLRNAEYADRAADDDLLRDFLGAAFSRLEAVVSKPGRPPESRKAVSRYTQGLRRLRELTEASDREVRLAVLLSLGLGEGVTKFSLEFDEKQRIGAATAQEKGRSKGGFKRLEGIALADARAIRLATVYARSKPANNNAMARALHVIVIEEECRQGNRDQHITDADYDQLTRRDKYGEYTFKIRGPKRMAEIVGKS
jgi:hypothetical protein